MKKQYRIKKNEEFSRIISEKHSISSANFVVYCSKKEETVSRVGISVSKKIGNAVVRNKIKRQIREMARSIIDFSAYDKDIIIIVRKPYLNNDYKQNSDDLEKLIKKDIIV